MDIVVGPIVIRLGVAKFKNRVVLASSDIFKEPPIVLGGSFAENYVCTIDIAIIYSF